MKLPFKMTPGRRFAFAFWTGWAFHMASDLIAKSAMDKQWIAVGILTVLAFTLLVIYSKNIIKFEKEHTWMMLKTGGPKEEPDVTFPNHPVRPPPPPAPPKRKYKKGGLKS